MKQKGRGKFNAQYAKQGGKCALCGQPMTLEEATRDHVIPKSAGGSPDWENLQLVHAACNAKKGNRVPIDVQRNPIIAVASAWLDAEWFMRTGDSSCKHSKYLL